MSASLLTTVARVEQLERELARMDVDFRRLLGRQDRFRGERHTRLAVTVADPGEDPAYPEEPANVYPIRFLDPDIERPGGLRTFDYVERSGSDLPRSYAACLSDRYVPEGTVVLVTFQRGVEDPENQVEWFFDHSAGEEVIPFRLTYNLECGQQATAYRLRMVAGAWQDGDEILVFDDYGDLSGQGDEDEDRAKSYFGFAKERGSYDSDYGWDTPSDPREGLPHYTIIRLDRQAIFVAGTLYAPLDADGEGEIEVDLFWQGQPPAENEGGRVAVYDEQLLYRHAQTGAQVQATWDNCARKYRIVQCQQHSMTAIFTAAEDFDCGTEFVEVSGAGVPWDFSPFNQGIPAPAGDGVFNPLQLRGCTGDILLCRVRDNGNGAEGTEDWAIVQVIHRARQVPIDFRTQAVGSGSGITCAVQTKWLDVCVMGACPEPEWEDLLQFARVDVVEALIVSSSGVFEIHTPIFTPCVGESYLVELPSEICDTSSGGASSEEPPP